jgi:Flp pilus assembly protein TadB
MLIVSILTFFVVIFLLAAITVTVAWMGFLKSRVEDTDAARRDLEMVQEDELVDPQLAAEESGLFRSERLSTLNFWDTLLTRFDFTEILRTRIAQADLDWSVGRVTLAMLFCGMVAGLILAKFLSLFAAIAGGVLICRRFPWKCARRRLRPISAWDGRALSTTSAGACRCWK